MPAKKNAAADAADSEAAYKRYLPLAQKLTEAEQVPYRIDPLLAYHNVQVGLATLEPLIDTLKPALPKLDWKGLLDLRALAQAVVFAATQVTGKSRSDGELGTLLAEAAELRRLLLGTADMLTLHGTFPAAAVAKIRQGTGPIDRAGDLVALAALYRKYPAALKQQALVKAAQLERASSLGTELLGRLNPKRARGSKKADVAAVAAAAAVKARDQLASLLWQRHRDLRRAGYYHFGEALDQHVPSLQAGRSAVKKKATKPTPAPAPT